MSTQPESLLPSPAPGLDEPLEMLYACHERIDAQLVTLGRLVHWLPEHGADEQAAQAARSVVRYFDLAAHNHHLDEEEDLLPAMLQATADPAREELLALVTRIIAEHRSMSERWGVLRTALEAIAAQRSTRLSAHDVTAFSDAYRAHIALEEREILPLAARLLGEDVLEQISQRMTARRRVEPNGPD